MMNDPETWKYTHEQQIYKHASKGFSHDFRGKQKSTFIDHAFRESMDNLNMTHFSDLAI